LIGEIKLEKVEEDAATGTEELFCRIKVLRPQMLAQHSGNSGFDSKKFPKKVKYSFKLISDAN
jgi:hypothetical protein